MQSWCCQLDPRDKRQCEEEAARPDLGSAWAPGREGGAAFSRPAKLPADSERARVEKRQRLESKQVIKEVDKLAWAHVKGCPLAILALDLKRSPRPEAAMWPQEKRHLFPMEGVGAGVELGKA